MEKLSIFIGMISIIVFSNNYTVNGQQGPQKPDSFINPDHGTYLIDDLDSIVLISYSSPLDSLRLSRWDYSEIASPELLISTKSIWNTDIKEYRTTHRYETAHNEDGIQLSKAHFSYNWAIEILKNQAFAFH